MYGGSAINHFVRLLLLLVGLFAPSRGISVAAHQPLHWERCLQHLSPDRSQVAYEVCHTFSMLGRDRRTYGYRVDIRQVSPHVRKVVSFPRFQPPGHWTIAEVTAYTPFETPGSVTADGTPVGIGVAAATYPACASGLPYGTQVGIPGIWTVTVHDRGSGSFDCSKTWLDVWMPYSTYQALIRAGYWSNGLYKRVFIYEGRS